MEVKLENLHLKAIDKNEHETEEGTSETYSTVLESEKGDIKVTIKTEKALAGLVLGEDYSIKFATPQQKLEVKK